MNLYKLSFRNRCIITSILVSVIIPIFFVILYNINVQFGLIYSMYTYLVFTSIGGVLAVYFLYNFIYIERSNARVSQYAIKENTKFLTPIITLLLPMIIIDTLLLFNFSLINSYYFITKYLVMSGVLLIIVISRNPIKLLILSLLCIPFLNIFKYIFDGNVHNNILYFIIVLLIVILIILISRYLHFVWLKKHDENYFNKLYNLFVLVIIVFVFKDIFTEHYPMKFVDYAINIGDVSYAIAPYMLLFILFIGYNKIKNNKFTRKDITKAVVLIITVALAHTMLISAEARSKVECQKKYSLSQEGMVSNSAYFNVNDIFFNFKMVQANDLFDYLEKNVKYCVSDRYRLENTVLKGQTMDDEIKRRNEIIIAIDNSFFIVENKPGVVVDLIDSLISVNNHTYIMYKDSIYTYLNNNSKQNENEIKKINEFATKQNKKLVVLKTGSDRLLYDMLVRSFVYNQDQSKKNATVKTFNGLEYNEEEMNMFGTFSKESKLKIDEMIRKRGEK